MSKLFMGTTAKNNELGVHIHCKHVPWDFGYFTQLDNHLLWLQSWLY